ncbi:hypothetical protein [Comamonas terrigena]|uniref:hypothetical protein n=1 Tax=Comamonas terrigena TaxID=32013 RepID=UPI0028A1A7BF|nr:hypothetical protein [Comamonas terrigena]
MKIYSVNDLVENVAGLIESKENFIVNVMSGDFSLPVSVLEKEIEKRNMTCRVYSRNRGYVAAAASLITVLPALFNVAHNIATSNPDYILGKDHIDTFLYVEYKKN